MKHLILFLLMIMCLRVIGQENVEFSREKNYNRISLSKEGLEKFIKSIRYYHNENLPDSAELYFKHSISCELGRDNSSLTLKGFTQLENIEFDDQDFTDLELIYGYTNQPISSISLYLEHDYRKLIIKGTDQQKVNALFRELDEQLTANQNFLGFINWGSIFSPIIFCLFVFTIIVFINIKATDESSESLKLVKGIKGFCIILILIGVVYFFSPLKIDDLFPGFVLTADPTHWWDKYGNFIGVFVTLATILAAGIKYLRGIFTPTLPAVIPIEQNNLEEKSTGETSANSSQE